MEVLIHQVVEQPQAWRPDGGSGSTANGGVDFSEPVNVAKNDSFGLSEESSIRVSSDKDEGNALQWPLLEKNLKVDDIDIPKLVSSIINTQNPVSNLKDKFEPVLSFPTSSSEDNKVTNHTRNEESLKIEIVEESDEEVVELEFIRALDKLHTHTPHCPNCSSQINKVILRRKKRDDATTRPADLDAPRQDKTVDLFGCLSCFSIFIPSGNVLNPFRRLFGLKGKHGSTRIVGDEHAHVDNAADLRVPVNGSATTIKQGIIGKHAVESNGEYKQYISLDSIVPVISGHPVHPLGKHQQSGPSVEDGSPKPAGHDSEINQTEESLPNDHLIINVGGGTENVVERGSDAQGLSGSSSEPVEIAKCMVYGGLIELITSLSVVSSAAASGASTLNIFGVGLATLISGIFVFGHNLVDLKNDEYGRRSNEHQTDRYKDLLGNRRHFYIHATLAILSFLVFGLVPPVVYAFAFYRSDNKDYKILAVAATSLVCVVVLAAGQAYVKGMRKASGYVKVVMYYVAAAAGGSGVAYAAGHLIRLLMERLGWFGAGTPAAGGSGFAAWASY